LKKYEDAPLLDLASWSRDTFSLSLRIENDARLALLGEHSSLTIIAREFPSFAESSLAADSQIGFLTHAGNGDAVAIACGSIALMCDFC
jgi:hypothetical protein